MFSLLHHLIAPGIIVLTCLTMTACNSTSNHANESAGFDTRTVPVIYYGYATPETAGIPDWPINNYGLTHGSIANIDMYYYEVSSPDEMLSYLPDLILAMGIDYSGERIEGYLLSTDYVDAMSFSLPLDGFKPQNGEDLPLYSEDGTTVIGIFPMTH